MALPAPGTIIVLEATRPDGMPALRRATLVAGDDEQLGLHLRAGSLVDLRLGLGSPLRLHWSATPDQPHGAAETTVVSAYAQVGSERAVDGVVVAHLTSPTEERRAHVRAKVPGRVTWDGGEGDIVDLSAGGLRVTTTDEVSGPCPMTIESAGHRFEATVEPLARTGPELRLVITDATGDLADLIPGLVPALTLRPR